MPASSVADVLVTCVDDITAGSVVIGGIALNLLNTGLVLQNNHTDDLPILPNIVSPYNSPFNFSTPIAASAGYIVTIKAQPTPQVCSIQPGTESGALAASAVQVVLLCSP